MGAGVRDAFPPPMCVGEDIKSNVVEKVQSRWGNGTPCGLVEIGRGGAYVPARVAPQGRIRRSSPRTMRVFWAWKRRYANVRVGTQAPTLRILLGGLHVDFRPYGFVWVDCTRMYD